LRNIVKIIATLCRSCATDSTAEFGPPPTLLGDAKDMCYLPEKDQKALVHEAWLKRAVHSEHDYRSIADIMIHWAYESRTFSDSVSRFIISG
jgi:hypothetical protein